MDKTFIIAEAGVNHNADLKLAFKLIDAAIEAKADAVKFQTFKSENVISSIAPRAEYQKRNMSEVKASQLEMAKKLELNLEDFAKLKKYCDKVRIKFITTPFDFESANFIYSLVEVYKISSGEITNFPFLEHIAKKGKSIILSTGMSNLSEVEQAVETILKNQPKVKSNFPPLTLLHCTTNYPCPFGEVNLRALQTLKDAFKLPVGYSDHTMGIEVSIAAVSLGAAIIEKHFTLNRNMEGPDHKASLEPQELRKMVRAIRNVEKSLGNGIKKPTSSELEITKVVRRTMISTRDIKAGEVLEESDISIKRPGTGIQPKFKKIIIGMRLTKGIKKDKPFNWRNFK